MIKLDKLDKYFNRGKNNENHVLREISLELGNHGLVCILGESGSGKTTLLNTLGGLDTFSGGSITVDDQTMKKYEPKKIERLRNSKFGYVFQNYFLLQEYTVDYNIKLALNVFDMTEEEKQERTDYVLNALGMYKYRKKLVSQLSGGQQQRVSIARSLVKSSEIILADEPTGNLDEENTIKTMSILKSISKDCLVILVSHEKGIARFFADRIIEIRDGQVISDNENTPTDSYEKVDDANIYLKDMVQKSMSMSGVDINYYQQKDDVPKDGQDRINIRLAWKDGKLYIHSPEEVSLVLAGEEAGCEMLDRHRPRLEKQQVEEIEYALPRLEAKKDAHLSGREVWKMACENIRLMGKKQGFVIGILLAASIMLVAALADYMTQVMIDKKQFVTEDSHYVTVSLEETSSQDTAQVSNAAKEYFDKYMGTGGYDNIFIDTMGMLSLDHHTFAQMASVDAKLEGFSLVSVKNLKKEQLMYGRMPKNRYEIVVDRWLLDCFEDSDSILTSMFENPKSFLGEEVVTVGKGKNLTIVGISDNKEPTVYVNDNMSLAMSYIGSYVMSLKELQALYPGKYDDVTLEGNQILLPRGDYDSYERMLQFSTRDSGLDNATKLVAGKVEPIGSYPDDLGVDAVTTEENCKNVRSRFISSARKFKVYTDDVDGAIAYYQGTGSEFQKYFKVQAVSNYQEQMKEYVNNRRPDMNLKTILTLVIFGVSMLMIFFTVKSNAVSRSEELTVYRLIGISRGSILQAYVLEMVLVTAYACLPPIWITSGIIWFIASIPSLELGLTLPWWSVLALTLGMFLVNAVISILPVNGILRKPPAQLAVKD